LKNFCINPTHIKRMMFHPPVILVIVCCRSFSGGERNYSPLACLAEGGRGVGGCWSVL